MKGNLTKRARERLRLWNQGNSLKTGFRGREEETRGLLTEKAKRGKEITKLRFLARIRNGMHLEN